MKASASVEGIGSERKAKVQVGEKQYYYFVETDGPAVPYDGHHAQIYICDFSGPYRGSSTSACSRSSSVSTNIAFRTSWTWTAAGPLHRRA